MVKFKISALQELTDQQVRFAPPSKRQEQLAQAEKLLAELEPQKQYPYQYICFRITDYRPDAYPELVINGADLAHDLRQMIESLTVPAETMPEAIVTLEEISRQFNVSTKTIRRWRESGLVGRRIKRNGRLHLGFPRSVVDRFLANHGERIERGSRYSQLTDDEKEEILRRAKRMSRVNHASLTEISRRIARRLGRSQETVRYTIKNYDRQNPKDALFPEATGPLPQETKEVIYNLFRRGLPVEGLARRFHRNRSAVYRIVHEMQARSILDQAMEPIYHPCFDDPSLEGEIMGPMPEALAFEEQKKRMRAPKDAPPELAPLYEVPLLTREQEQHLFRQMNFLKHQAHQLRERIDPRNARVQDLDRLRDLLRQVAAVKEQLVNSNMRLVVSIAKKHSAASENFFELLSDGNMSLLRAVDKFDFSRGNKFSTYASWAIMKNFARSIPDQRHRRDRYQTGHEEMFEIAADHRSNEREILASQQQATSHVNRLLDHLEPRLQRIIRMRVGLDKFSEGMKLEEIAKVEGITKERVRQLCLRGMSQLRTLAKEEKLEM